MTSMRVLAYRRVMKTLQGIGARALWAAEHERVREAADSLLFRRELDEPDVRHALAAAAVLTDDLIDAEGCTPRRAQQLLDDMLACGPDVAADVRWPREGASVRAVSVRGTEWRRDKRFACGWAVDPKLTLRLASRSSSPTRPPLWGWAPPTRSSRTWRSSKPPSTRALTSARCAQPASRGL
jgi:hypothetical protein